jgi:hypothetical protein
VCLRQLAQCRVAREAQYGRFLANERVTVSKVIEGWGDRTQHAVAGRHVLAIQDTSEFKFATTPANRRGLGKVKKGKSHGVLLHAMIAVDADNGALLGLVSGDVWTRSAEAAAPHAKRPLADKESRRWPDTVDSARPVLAAAAGVTVVNDREGEFFAHWCRTPADNVHLLTRLMNDHPVVEGGTVRDAIAGRPLAGAIHIELRERHDRPARSADLELRFGTMLIKRPANTIERDLPEHRPVSVVEVREPNPPDGAEPVHWILLTSHPVETFDQACRIVDWYRCRWTIEQFFRTLKRQGMRVEDSQITQADRLCKIVAIAAKAAAIVMMLVHARDGTSLQPATAALSADQISFVEKLNLKIQGKTARQRNPHPPASMAWAAWVIAKLGGWHEYQAKPPGPITFYNGLRYFNAAFEGWKLNDVLIPSHSNGEGLGYRAGARMWPSASRSRPAWAFCSRVPPRRGLISKIWTRPSSAIL